MKPESAACPVRPGLVTSPIAASRGIGSIHRPTACVGVADDGGKARLRHTAADVAFLLCTLAAGAPGSPLSTAPHAKESIA